MPSLLVICDAKVHCPACRADGPDGDRTRAEFARHYSVPDDFTCPWGMAGEIKRLAALPDNALANVARQAQAEAFARAVKDHWAIEGPKLWAELHTWARTCDLSTDKGVVAAMFWLNEFGDRIPCGECRGHWLEMRQQHPADYDSNAALYQWTVDRHNDVNRRLGKPVWLPVVE